VTLDPLQLIRRTDSDPPRFSALLHEWIDPGALAKIAGHLLERSSESRLATGAGRYTATLGAEPTGVSARLALAMPERYRIDFETDRAPKPQNIICDGEHLWTVYAGRVAIKDARPVPAGISQLADLSWLLDEYSLTSEGSVTVAGREAALLRAVPTDDYATGESAFSRQPILANKIDLAVDSELGITLTQQWHFDDQLVLRTELSDLSTEVADSAFEYEPPPGLRLLTDPTPLAEAGISPGKAAWHVAQGSARLLGDVGRWLARGGPQSR
jgi:outer membrane lipoprotein-sorting protein